ncbi:TPA: hypothetical protein ACGIK9_002790 [Acinetobacter baumannii]|uniref:hypothetical protein n=1 Tax=Acinetobacter baumannii TaxID=470 RepID=UPI0033906BA2
MQRLLVHRFASVDTSSDKGFVVPVALENEDGTITPTHREDFPNDNRIWISKEFNSIEQNYSPTELFYLTAYYESSETIENTTNANMCKFFSLGTSAARVDRNSYLQLIKLSELPDVHSGRIKLSTNIVLPPYGTPFFINVDEYVYGPFLARKEVGIQDDIIFETYNKSTPLGIQNNHIGKVKLTDIEDLNILLSISHNGLFGKYISNLHVMRNAKSLESIDYISDTNLITFFLKAEYGKDGKSPLSKSAASTLKAAIEENIKKNNLNVNEHIRIERLCGLLDQFLNADVQGLEIIKNFLKSSDGEKFLGDFVTRNQKQLLDEHIKQLTEKNEKELASIRETHDANLSRYNQQYLSEKQVIEGKIAKLHKDLEEAQQQTAEERKKLNTTSVNEEIDRLKAELVVLQNKHGQYVEYDQLTEEIARLKIRKEMTEEDLTTIKNDIGEAKKALRHQQTLLQSPSLTDNVVNHFTIQQLLNSKKVNQKSDPIELTKLSKASINVTGETRESYIKYLQSEINGKLERQLSYSETANLLVSIMQSYLTILNGNPGIGKTSTVTNFADALKITSNEPGKIGNFLNVPVGRGWTSKRNLLGFMNPVEHIYNPADTGIYNLLKALSDNSKILEPENFNHDFLSLILLDEANLSAMEHYWADFLSICDKFQNGSHINLGGVKGEVLELPESLRFVGTINNDATVEPLSDRLLDRASIITLNHFDTLNGSAASNPIELMEAELFNGAVPYKELKEAFIVDSTAMNVDSSDTGAGLITQVTAILGAELSNCNSITISARKLKAIKNYLLVANELNYQEITPADFAIAQHIIPKIRGYGKPFKGRLDELENLFKESHLSLSRRLLKQILDNGGNYDDTFSLL